MSLPVYNTVHITLHAPISSIITFDRLHLNNLLPTFKQYNNQLDPPYRVENAQSEKAEGKFAMIIN